MHRRSLHCLDRLLLRQRLSDRVTGIELAGHLDLRQGALLVLQVRALDQLVGHALVDVERKHPLPHQFHALFNGQEVLASRAQLGRNKLPLIVQLLQ